MKFDIHIAFRNTNTRYSRHFFNEPEMEKIEDVHPFEEFSNSNTNVNLNWCDIFKSKLFSDQYQGFCSAASSLQSMSTLSAIIHSREGQRILILWRRQVFQKKKRMVTWVFREEFMRNPRQDPNFIHQPPWTNHYILLLFLGSCFFKLY